MCVHDMFMWVHRPWDTGEGKWIALCRQVFLPTFIKYGLWESELRLPDLCGKQLNLVSHLTGMKHTVSSKFL